MSKGSKRRSARQIDRDFEYIFSDLQPAKKEPPLSQKPWLAMTPGQIDQAYFHLGKADRTQMKREARQQIERIIVQETISNETYS